MPIIVHLADVHLGTPFASLPALVGERCRELHYAALLHAIDAANNQNAAVILIAGDLLDTPDASLQICARVMDILSRAQCPVLISPGNHDYLHPRSPYRAATLPANVHIYTGTQLQPFELDENTAVWGAAFCDMSARIPLDAPLDPQKCNILCMHAELVENNAYNPVSPAALATSGFDYAAFGHNHEYSGVLLAGDTFYACPGCFVGRTQKEDGARGYLIGSVEKGSAALRFVRSEGVPFETLTLDMSEIPNDHALGRAVAAHIPETHACACLTLALIGERLYEPDLIGLKNALSKICLHAALRDRTTRTHDLWRYLENDDLRGAVTRRFHETFTSTTDALAQNNVRLALQIALAAFDGTDLPG